MTRDWVWIITDAQTDRVSSGLVLQTNSAEKPSYQEVTKRLPKSLNR